MKTFFWFGVACVVLGLVSFFVNVPRTQRETLQAGNFKVGVSSTEERKMPGYVGGILIAGGLGMMIAGSREARR